MKQNSNGYLMLYFQNKPPGSDKIELGVDADGRVLALHSHLSAERTNSQPLAATAFGKQDWLDEAEPPRRMQIRPAPYCYQKLSTMTVDCSQETPIVTRVEHIVSPTHARDSQ